MLNPSNKPTNTNKPVNAKKITGAGTEVGGLLKATDDSKPVQLKADLQKLDLVGDQKLSDVAGAGATGADELLKGTEEDAVSIKPDVKKMSGDVTAIGDQKLSDVAAGGLTLDPADIGDKGATFEEPSGGDIALKGTLGKTTSNKA